MTGTLSILNVGEGDVKISFDKNNPEERKRASKVVADMLRAGYAILIKVGQKDGEDVFKRAIKFDPETCEYIVAGAVATDETPPKPESFAKGTSARNPVTRVPAERTHAVSVGRTAGGYDPNILSRIRRGSTLGDARKVVR